MSKNKIKKKFRKDLKMFESLSERFIGETKNKFENFYQDIKKNREKRKSRLEKEKKIQEKKEIQLQKKQVQKDKVNKAKEERLQILAQQRLIIDNEKQITDEKKKQLKIQGMMMMMSGNPLGILGFASPGFAQGGAVSKGKPIMVGERGPEMFIPNSTGQITQNARGGMGGAVNVNFTINTIDSRGFDQALVENRGTITSIINNALSEKGRGALV